MIDLCIKKTGSFSIPSRWIVEPGLFPAFRPSGLQAIFLQKKGKIDTALEHILLLNGLNQI